MFNQLFEKKHTIQRQLNYPFLKERLQYLQYWHDNGASKNFLQQIARNLLIIVDLLYLKRKRKFTILEIEQSAKKWNKHFYKKAKTKNYSYSNGMICNLIKISTRWLSMLNLLKSIPKQSNLFSKQLLKYDKYLREERGLSEITIR